MLTACSLPGSDRKDGAAPHEGGQLLKPAGLLFAGFDADGDYAVSRNEFETGIERAFVRADTDGSQKLSLVEYQNWAARALGSKTALPSWIGVDRDADRTIDAAEFRAEFTRLAEAYGLSGPEGLAVGALTRDAGATTAGRQSQGTPRRQGRSPSRSGRGF